MMQPSDDIRPLLDELHTVEENCLYTAQCHFIIADRRTTQIRFVYVGTSILSAIVGALVVIQPAWTMLGIVPLVAGVAGAVAAGLGADKDVYAHQVAGNVLTRVRHEARALREAFALSMPREELQSRVQMISASYNATIQGLPITDKSSMSEARAFIKQGVFHPDFREVEGALSQVKTSQELPSKGEG